MPETQTEYAVVANTQTGRRVVVTSFDKDHIERQHGFWSMVLNANPEIQSRTVIRTEWKPC